MSLLHGALAAVECRVEEILERHRHALIVAEPIAIATEPAAEALVYWRSQYSAARAVPRAAAE